MWHSLLEKTERNIIVISDKIDVSKFIDRALFKDIGYFTIILNKYRQTQNNLIIDDLQIIHKIDDAVAYRNSEDASVEGWVLFISKEDGLLSSLSSVAHIVEQPHLKLLEYKMNEVGLSQHHIKQLSELVRNDDLDEDRFWASLMSVDRSDFIRALGVIYAESADIKKYNYDYREIISQHINDVSLLEKTVADLPLDQANKYQNFIHRLNERVIKDYNFETELSRELNDPELQELLASIDLPYKAPVKLSAIVRLSGGNYTRVNSKIYFYSSEDTKISISLENTDGLLTTNNNREQRIQCRAGELVNLIADHAILEVTVSSEVKSAGSLEYRFYSVNEENEGAYFLENTKVIRLSKTQSEYNISSFNQNTVLYIIHSSDDLPKCPDAQIEKLFQCSGYCLSKLSAFNSEETVIYISFKNFGYSLHGFCLNEAETVVLSDGIQKKRYSGLDYGNRVFSVVNSNNLYDIEKNLLNSSSLNIIESYDHNTLIDNGTLIFSSNLDQYDIQENTCYLSSEHLLKCWNDIKEKLNSLEYRPSTYITMIRELGPSLITRFYDLFNISLQLDFIQTTRFLTISIYEDSKLQSIILPFFHPVVLMDLHKYFESYGVDDRISLNAHYTPSFLKSLWINNETLVVLENTGHFQPVFVHERCNLRKLISKYSLNIETNTFARFRRLNDDQVIRSFEAMFDYHGFSRVFHVRLLIDNEAEIRRLISLILGNTFFRDRLNDSTLYIHLSESLFDTLTTYYTSGQDFIKIARSESTIEYDLLIDARENDDVKYTIKPKSLETASNFLSVGVPLFPYENPDSLAIRVAYPAGFEAHKKLSCPSNQDFVVSIRSKDQEIDDYRRAQIISLQIERFNLLSGSLSHLVYEMRSVNRLRYSSYQKSNFVIAIRGTKQLRARLAHGLAEYDITGHLDDIEKGLLQENLFSFSHMFGNRNKMKGIVGELMTFDALNRLCRKWQTGYLIPLDPIIVELQLYLRASSENNWTRYPDFLLLRFQDDNCHIHFVEVKSRLECDYNGVLLDQLDPIKKAIIDWLGDIGHSELERKRFVAFLMEYLIRVTLDNMPLERLESVYKWIGAPNARVEVKNSILVHLDETQQSSVEFVDQCIVVKHSFRSSLSEYLGKDGNNGLQKSIDGIFNSDSGLKKHIESSEFIELTNETEALESHDSVVPYLSEEDNVASDLVSFDLSQGREELYSDLKMAYKDVQRRLGREGIYLNDSTTSVKLSPMNVRFSYASTEGMSIRSIKSKSSDIALWLKLPQGQSVTIDSDMGNVVMEYPLPTASRMFFEYSEICGTTVIEDELSVPIGVDEDGKVVLFQFGSNSPHLLIGGTTGSGKSVALETIVGGLLSRYDHTQLNVVIVDPKQTELVDFEAAKAVRDNCLNADVGYNADHAIEILKKAVTEMEHRNDLFASMSRELKSQSRISRSLKNISEYNKHTLREHLPRILIVLDEYADLVSDAAKKKELQSNLVRIAQKGRSTGIHLIVATQKPVVEVIDTVIKSNLPASLALRVSKANDSIVIMDEGGAEGLLGQGDAFLKIGSMKTRLQIARFGEDQFSKLF
jgi:Cdc6-like AAA superfamily ATPase